MIPAVTIRLYDQETFSDRSLGTHGDCTRACIRTICQADMPDLPHPVALGGGWNDEFFDVLEDVYGLLYRTNNERPGKDWSFLPRVAMAIGPTVRTAPGATGVKHLVVYDRLASRVIHDPHPSRAGLTAITGFAWLVPVVP